MTAADPATMRRPPRAVAETIAVLSFVAGRVRDASTALANGDPAGDASPRLHRVVDLLHRLSASPHQDRDTWSLLVALRDELSGYLLAASTLEETGVAPDVIIHLLQRGADQADQALARIRARQEQAEPA